MYYHCSTDQWLLYNPKSYLLHVVCITYSEYLIIQATPSAPMAEPEKTPSNQKIYPPLPEEVRHETYHPNPTIQHAVEAMMAMGFTNEGSWLTHLLVAQNGNIDKALDIIHPVIRRH